MRALDILLNLIFPPVCVFCREALAYDATEALCPQCRSRYESEKGFICPDCQKIHKECACLSKNMKRYGTTALHVAEYVKEESAVRAMILAAKESSYEYLYRFLASELAALVKARVPSYEECLLTYVPRSRKKEIKYGVDQAKCASKKLAKRLGIEHQTLFYHRESREQKGLNLKEREQNAAVSFFLIEKVAPLVKGKRILLYDDVVTTGATVASCASLLKSAGAKEVIYLSFGKTYRKTQKKTAALPKSKKSYRVLSKIPF